MNDQYNAGYEKGYSKGKNHKKKEANSNDNQYVLGFNAGYKDGRSASKVAKIVVNHPAIEVVKVVQQSLKYIPAPSQDWTKDFEVKGSIVK